MPSVAPSVAPSAAPTFTQSSSPEAAVDAGPALADTTVGVLDTVEVPADIEEPEEEEPRFGNEIIVGQGACTNDSDIEALGGFDPVDDFMTVGMACINTQADPGQTDDDQLVACLVEELGTGYGFSEECGDTSTRRARAAQPVTWQRCLRRR